MPSWKKVIISGSNAALNDVNLTGELDIDTTKLRTYENNGIITGTNVVGSFPTSEGNGANFEYVVKSTVDYRVGQIMAVWDGVDVFYNEVTTIDLGNTTDIILQVDIAAGNVRLIADSLSSGWTVKALAKVL